MPRDLKILIESQLKKKNVTEGHYSMTTVSWFLVLSKHSKNSVLLTRGW